SLQNFLVMKEKFLAPSSIYDAKTIGRLSRRRRNPLVDTGLLGYAEEKLGRTLVAVVEGVVELLQSAFPKPRLGDRQQEWVLKSAFRLLAAKVLRDKNVPSFKTIDLNDV